MAVVSALVIAVAGCKTDQDTSTPEAGSDHNTITSDASDQGTVMPDVMGQKLDIALDDIEQAGVEDEVQILGGGTFGVVVKSNWTVCEQSPTAGEAVTTAPQLTVDRSCEEDGPEPSETPSAESTEEPSVEPTEEPSVEPTEAAENLTANNNADLAALLASDEDYAKSAKFAAQYQGKVIEFDGNIADMANHGDYDTRYDILILAGDYSETSASGPYFQFRDVNISDLNLTGKVPDSIGTGDNLHIIARVGEFNPDNGLFFLDPISTKVR